MPCHKCNGHWVCDPDATSDPCLQAMAFKVPPEDPPPEKPQSGTSTWKKVSELEVATAGAYEFWLRVGCKVKALPAGESPGQETPPWYYAGYIELDSDTYDLYCRKPEGKPRLQLMVTKHPES